MPIRPARGYRDRWRDWSLSEEKLLVQMAKLIPNQWNRIAATVGRPVPECMDHYKKLMYVNLLGFTFI